MPLAYIHFEPCPKCSETDPPEIHIAGMHNGDPTYRAICKTCHYEQKDAYDSVEECAKAWNKESNKAWYHILESEYTKLMQRFNNFN